MTDTIAASVAPESEVHAPEQNYTEQKTSEATPQSVDQIVGRYAPIVEGIKDNRQIDIAKEINNGYDEMFKRVYEEHPLYGKAVDLLSKPRITRPLVPHIERVAIGSYLENKKEELEGLEKDVRKLERANREYVTCINDLGKKGRSASVDYLKLEDGVRELTEKKSELEDKLVEYKQKIKQNPYDGELADKITFVEDELEKMEPNLEVFREKQQNLGDLVDELGDEYQMKVREFAPHQTVYYTLKGKVRGIKRTITEVERAIKNTRKAKGYMWLLKKAAVVGSDAEKLTDVLEIVYQTQDSVFKRILDGGERNNGKKATQPDYQRHHQLLKTQQQKRAEDIHHKIDLFLS